MMKCGSPTFFGSLIHIHGPVKSSGSLLALLAELAAWAALIAFLRLVVGGSDFKLRTSWASSILPAHLAVAASGLIPLVSFGGTVARCDVPVPVVTAGERRESALSGIKDGDGGTDGLTIASQRVKHISAEKLMGGGVDSGPSAKSGKKFRKS